MIVSNLTALVPVALTVISLLCAESLVPAIEELYRGFFLGGVLFFFGSITEMLGLRGRIFWLPVWLVGMMGIAFEVSGMWGQIWYCYRLDVSHDRVVAK